MRKKDIEINLLEVKCVIGNTSDVTVTKLKEMMTKNHNVVYIWNWYKYDVELNNGQCYLIETALKSNVLLTQTFLKKSNELQYFSCF